MWARSTSNPTFNKISGQSGKQIVFKQFGDKTVITEYPDVSRMKPSPLQKYRLRFKEAVAYAMKINGDPLLRAEYLQKLKPAENVCRYALKEYLKKHK